ncbi:MAG TPA: hypothetical protein VMG12_10465, partial [Polyangiaceae bacterium]|nr:hypothetical protein [Polyangiaceae bacterium]
MPSGRRVRARTPWVAALALVACSRAHSSPPVSSVEAVGGARVAQPRIDGDDDYAGRTQRLYLSGKGTDDAVDWDFMVSTGQRAGVWSTLPVP